MSHTPIELKGSNFTLSVIHLYSMQPDLIRQALEEKIAQAPAFLRNAPVVVNVALLDETADWQPIWQVFQQTGLRLVGVSGCTNDALKIQIMRSGLALLSEGKNKTDSKSQPQADTPAKPCVSKTQWIDAPVRSGQRIYAPHGDLVVTNQVSAGAELIADGNIHIYGTMRGRALAGASGDKTAQIVASHLAAELVSIAGVYWLSEQIPEHYHDKAVRLHLTESVITIDLLK